MTTTKLKNLTLVTVSGAHRTGKTTLLGDLEERLSDDKDVKIGVVESCSSKLFERIRLGEIELPRDTQIPTEYDDINRYGLRALFQRKLPSSLAFEVESAVARVLQDRPIKNHTVLLIDRWFPDIYAYTEIEAPGKGHAALREEVRGLCQQNFDALMQDIPRHALFSRLVSVFVPLSASDFKVKDSQKGKFRATCDRAKWEATCIKNWRSVTSAQSKSDLTFISSSNRAKRVEEVLALLSSTANS